MYPSFTGRLIEWLAKGDKMVKRIFCIFSLSALQYLLFNYVKAVLVSFTGHAMV